MTNIIKNSLKLNELNLPEQAALQEIFKEKPSLNLTVSSQIILNDDKEFW